MIHLNEMAVMNAARLSARVKPWTPKKSKKRLTAVSLIFLAFSVGIVHHASWNAILVKEIRRSVVEDESLKTSIERVEKLQTTVRGFLKDALRQEAIVCFFSELIRNYENKFTEQEKKECIQLISCVDEAYKDEGLDAPMIFAWLEKESGGNPEAVSYAGAKGLTQLMDFNADKALAAMGYGNYDRKLIFNPAVNLRGGLDHLSRLIKYWERERIRNRNLVLFYSLHSYMWGSENTRILFVTQGRTDIPGLEYVNWILNRRFFWEQRLENWIRSEGILRQPLTD